MQLVEIEPRPSFRVSHMPHMPRPPSVDHGVISFLWAVGLGAYIYFGSLAVGVSAGTAFIFSALAALAIFLFVRVFGENRPPRRYAVRPRSSQRPTGRD
jgi:drug/metabolite transporter (DMT)-like permease